MKTTAVILAAGQGTRMHSDLPKVLHRLAGQPMIRYLLDAAGAATTEIPVAVIGYQADAVREAVGPGARFVLQEEQLGTGHAVLQAEKTLDDSSDLVLVVNGDLPLLTAETLSQLVEAQQVHEGPFTMLTSITDDPRGFGRIVRDPGGGVRAIVEEAQASPEELAIRELNVGAYCFQADWLWKALTRIPLSPKGEYYLTDLVQLAVQGQESVRALVLDDPEEAVGINSRVHLAEAEAVLRRRINHRWMDEGVTLMDPLTTYIDSGVTIGVDTVILPNTQLQGATRVGKHCRLGPNTLIQDTRIGDRCAVLASVVEQAVLEDDVDVGPFGHLRKGARLGQGTHMGNFGEVKNATLGPGVKMGHFSYIGDATIGANTNIGAGTITCNYDGKSKHHTTIGANAFIGSDTMLVAPLNLGEGARTGAGAVVTRDIPAHTLAVGMPARALRKLKGTRESRE